MLRFHCHAFLGVRGGWDFFAFRIFEFPDCDGKYIARWREAFNRLAREETVPLLDEDGAGGLGSEDEADEIVRLLRLGGRVVLRRLSGGREGEAFRVRSMRNRFQLRCPFRLQRPFVSFFIIRVDCASIRRRDGRDVVHALHAALDLETRRAGLDERGNLADEAQIFGIQNVRAVFVLRHRPILAGPRLFDELIAETAGLNALAAIGLACAVGKIIRQKAAA